MNWSEISAVASIGSFFLVLAGGAVLWGKMTERVSGLTKRVDSHKGELAALDGRVNAHDVQIGRLEEWKSGFNAAARVSGRTPEVA